MSISHADLVEYKFRTCGFLFPSALQHFVDFQSMQRMWISFTFKLKMRHTCEHTHSLLDFSLCNYIFRWENSSEFVCVVWKDEYFGKVSIDSNHLWVYTRDISKFTYIYTLIQPRQCETLHMSVVLSL